MPSNYWAKRYEDESERAFGLGKMTSKNLREQADVIIRRMEKNVNDWYQRYADENGISLADARKELNARELKAFKMTLEEYRRQSEQEGLSEEHQKMLKQASIRKRLDREQELYINTVHELERWAKTQDTDISDLLNKVYESTNYRTAHLTQTMKGEYGKYGQVDPNTVQRIIHSPWAPDGKDFSERIWDNRKKLAKTMQSEFTQAMIIGQGTADISKAIAKNMNTSYSNANRLVETELARVHSQAFMDCMAELDVDAVEILATLDSKTSPICRRMDGKVIQRKDAKPGVTIPPFHCHCRSTTVPYLGDDLADIAGSGTRAARDPKTGKTVFVEGELDYGDWEDVYVKQSKTLKDIRPQSVQSTMRPDAGHYKAYDKGLPQEMPKNTGKVPPHGKGEPTTPYDVNREAVNAKQWFDAIKALGFSRQVTRLIRKEALKCLTKNDGINRERGIIMSTDGRIIGEESFGAIGGNNVRIHIPDPPKGHKKHADNSLIVIHNHPKNIPFSIADITAYLRNPSIHTAIVVCPNGSIYSIQNIRKDMSKKQVDVLEKDIQTLYTNLEKNHTTGRSLTLLLKDLELRGVLKYYEA